MSVARLMTAALLIATATAPVAAQDAVTGIAGSELVSRTATGEVHLVIEPALSERRLALRIVVRNAGAAAQSFAPDAVAIAADGKPVALATLAQLLGTASSAEAGRTTSQANAAPQMQVTTSGQTDVTGFTGGSGLTAGGVPTDTVNRTQTAPDPAYAAALEAALLRPGTVAPGALVSGQLFSAPLKRGAKQVAVTVNFAGTAHRFDVPAPR